MREVLNAHTQWGSIGDNDVDLAEYASKNDTVL
jgi:hypothetical protein